MDKTFEYLKKISPTGFMHICISIDWELIEKLSVHWTITGEDQFDDYWDLCSFIIQTDFDKKRIFVPDHIFPLLNNLFECKYIFDVEDLPEGEKLKLYYEKKTSPKMRRRNACVVTSIKSVKEAVFKRDGDRCRFCGSQIDLTVDHIIPVSQGGKDEFGNFQTLCRKCNSSKSNKKL